ncbi:MAG: phosphatidylserine decarboxylase [Desulfobacterales bacterium]|nr:phosphatidylserine decarboxylase [Desulfobacterales bacterium]
MADDILIYNRITRRIDVERVYGSQWMTLFYGRPWGRAITNRLLCRHPLSRLYGAIQRSGLSRGNIAAFIAQYGIDLGEAIVPPGGFASFNDFFIRRLTPAARPVDPDPTALIAPADSRLQLFAIENHTRLTIKGASMTLPQLLGCPALDQGFEGGQCLVFRLAPCDYHRFGYVDDGRQGPVHAIDGPLHSVSPLSLRHKPDVHATNYRHWCLVQSPRLGTLIQIEVGAMMVGSIVQNLPQGGPCRRGQEKGYFQFGGSTVIVILPPGRAVIDADIAEYSSQGIETLVRYGERVGSILTA